MDAIDLQLLKGKWEQLLHILADRFGEEPDLQALLFLIGVATNFNGYQRTTDDIDVWIEDTIENRRKFRFAFKEYSGEDFSMIERMQIIPGWTNFNLNNGYKLDLMVNMKGLEDYSFDECHKSATIAEIDEIHVPFLQH